MFKKRGQVTLYIIVGVFIVIGVALFFFLKSSSTEEISEQSLTLTEAQLTPVKERVTKCLEEVSGNAFDYVGKRGGYLTPANSLEVGGINVAYGLYKDSADRYINNLPLRSILAEQFSMYFDSDKGKAEFKKCINNFNPLDYDVKELSAPKVSMIITQQGVSINADYKLKVTKSTAEAILTIFATQVQIDILPVYMLATDILNEEYNTHSFDTGAWILQEPRSARLKEIAPIQDNIDKVYYMLISASEDFEFRMVVQR